MRKLRVLVLSMVFPPDGVSTAQLVGEIVEDVQTLGHDVTVLTSQPHYNFDGALRARQPIDWHWSRLFGTSNFHSARVVHVRMGAKSPRVIGRSMQWLWFHIVSFLLSFRGSIDVCLAVSPPPTLAVQSAIRRTLGGPPFVYAVWEAYPDILFAMGILKPGSVPGRLARVLEGWTYRRASRVMFLSKRMLETAQEREPRLRSVGTVVPTFVDVDTFAPTSRLTRLRRELGITDSQFVLGYAGNLGPAQDLSVVLEAAKQLCVRDDIVLLICGSGSDEARLQAQAEGLPNVFFTGHLAFAQMPEVYATFDASIASLAAGLSSEALPSKVYRSMACGRPILAITDVDSALAELVLEASCGLVAQPRPDAVMDAIEIMAGADRDPWAQAARTCVVATASRRTVVAQIEQILQEAAAARS